MVQQIAIYPPKGPGLLNEPVTSNVKLRLAIKPLSWQIAIIDWNIPEMQQAIKRLILEQWQLRKKI